MEIILVDPNLVCPFFGNIFFDPNYGVQASGLRPATLLKKRL